MNAGDSFLIYLQILFKAMDQMRGNIEKRRRSRTEAWGLQGLEIGQRRRRQERNPRRGSQ